MQQTPLSQHLDHVDTLTATITKTKAIVDAVNCNLRNHGMLTANLVSADGLADLLWQASDNLRVIEENVNALHQSYTEQPKSGRSTEDILAPTRTLLSTLMHNFQSSDSATLPVRNVAEILAIIDDNITACSNMNEGRA